ncbi:hypothetical protein ACEPAG_3896 [Sanghuangporus baumii]
MMADVHVLRIVTRTHYTSQALPDHLSVSSSSSTMAFSLPPFAGILLAMFMAVTLSRAGSLDARAPQEADDGDITSLHFYTPVPSYTIPPWYSRTSSATRPTSSVTFAFGPISNMSVCGRGDITWSYSGDTYYMMGIAAMPVELSGSGSGDSSPTVIVILNGGLAVGSYTWSPVNVPAGQYVMEVSIPNVNSLYFSEPFYIVDGLDTSCLESTSSSASSSGTAGTSSSPATANSSSAHSSSAGDASGVPVLGAVSDGSSLSSGGIAGVVIGGVIFVGALIAILILLRRCRSNRSAGAPRGGLFEKRRPKGAIIISSRGGSISSAHGVPARGMGSGFGVGPHYSLNDPSRSDVGHGISEENVRSPSLTGEKPVDHAPVDFGAFPPAVVHRSTHAYRDSLGSAMSGSTTAAGSPVVATNHYRPSRQWSLQNTSDPFASGPPTPSPRASEDYHGLPDNQVPVALFSPSSASSTPHTYGSPGVPRDISIASSSSPDLAYEPEVASPSGPAAAPTAHRRAPPVPQTAVPVSTYQPRSRGKSASARKPVPVYVPSAGEAVELVETPPRSATSGAGPYYDNTSGQHSKVSLGQSSSAGNDWSSAAAHSHSSPSGGSHGSFLSETSRRSVPGIAGRGDIPELNHKSSFGDRQMHVLMPDPPSQQMQ